MKEQVTCIKLSPELGDGSLSTIIPIDKEEMSIDSACEFLREWLKNHDDYIGDEVTISIVKMTQEKIDNLPDM